MAMALQSAALALEPLLAWTRGELSWPASIATVNRRLHRRFRTRLASAYALHPFLLEPRRQRWLALAGRADAVNGKRQQGNTGQKEYKGENRQ